MAEAGDKNKNPGLIEDDIDDVTEDALRDYDAPSKPLSHPVAEDKPSDPNSMLPPGMDMLGEAFDPSHLEELNSMMEGMLGKELMEEYQAFSKELEENLPDMFNLQGLESELFSPYNQNENQPTSKPANKITSKTADETIEDLHKNLELANSVLPPDPPCLQKEGENILGMVKELMGDLLSRDVLYGPLRDLSKQYPKLLEERKDMNGDDRKRYTRQYSIIQEICKLYESESNSDSQETRNNREERILKLIQELQSLGQPPPGVIEDGPAIPNFSQLLGPNNSCNPQ